MSKRKTLLRLLLFGIPMGLMLFSITVVARNADAQSGSRQPATNRVPNLPTNAFNYASPNLPAHFLTRSVRRTDNTPRNNPVTDAGATLGRVLFYDVTLSANNTTSCASCHAQENSFGDPARLSEGFDGELTGRHSPSLANARYYQRENFFWDERADTLEDQVLMPFQDPVEMGLTLNVLVNKVESADYYAPLFEDAFGDDDVTTDRISLALAQFVRSMVSYESKFDQVVAGEARFTASEARGFRIFDGRGRCSQCHETTNLTLDQPRNIGLDRTNTVDGGVGDATGNNNDLGEFKVASLRNVAVSGPYMHDGRFSTLNQVLNHYDGGIQDNPNLDNILEQRGRPDQINLSRRDRQDIIAFLNTLTDQSFLTDPKFSDPFVTAPSTFGSSR